MDWFEAVTENYMDSGGRPVQILEQVRKHYPVALHGVSLSIGSVDPLRPQYLERLKTLADHIDPFIVSDHLCWASVDGHELHDLLPLPFTEEALAHIVNRVERVQGFLKRTILLENVSSYVTYRHSTIPEWEFLAEISRRSGCGILLDLNNIFVNAVNHHFDPEDFLKGIPGKNVGQFHLAGHTDKGTYLFDTHSDSVCDPVWNLYRLALEMWGTVPTLIEWDENIPAFERLSEEAAKARKIYQEYIKNNQFPQSFRAQREISGQRDPRLCEAVQTSLRRSRVSSQKALLEMTGRYPLAEIQTQFRRQMEEEASDAKAEVPLNPQGGVPGRERIAIYTGGYFARTQDSLKEVFPAVAHVLGSEVLHNLAHDYARKFPSMNYNLTFLGKHLPEFLKIWPAASELPFLPELAELEWKISMAFHAFDRTPLAPGSLGNLSIEEWARTSLVFQPSTAVLKSAWPVLDIWSARHTPPEQIRIELKNRPQNVLIYRRGWEVQCRLIGDSEFQMTQSLLNKETLGAACEAVEGEEMAAVSEWFSRWSQDGLIAGCETAQNA
jgi:hypothetical protein